MEATPGWEQSKENAAPLARGRKVGTLGRTGLQRRVDKERMVEEYEKLVRPSEASHCTEMDGDPVVHWLSYIKDYQESFPSDTNDQFLLMERCTRALVKMKQYSNDDRFITVCARYAERTNDPGQIFKFLHQQKVGQKSALFWTAWAFVAEKANDFPFAEQVYKKGLSKNAQPPGLLKSRHQQFQRRMSRHWLNSSQANDHLGDEEEESIQRGALGGISREGARRNHRSNARYRMHEQNPRSFVPPSNNNVGAGRGGAFPIYVEQAGENAENGYNLDQTNAGTKKRVLETDAERKKENQKEAERWNERGGISSSHAPKRSQHHQRHTSGPPPAFAVFVDEECAAQHEQEAQMQRVQDERRRRQRDERTFREREDGGLVEKLTNDPLRYFRNPSQLEADQTEINTDLPRHEKKPEPERKIRGYRKVLLKDLSGLEQCFQEARAQSKYFSIVSSDRNFNQLHVDRPNALEDSKMDIDEDMSFEEDCSLATPRFGSNSDGPRPPKNSKRVHSAMETPGTSFEASLNLTAVSAASSTVNEAHATGLPATRDEQTINTKFAFKELSMMFSSPAFGGDDGSRRPLQSRSMHKLDAAKAEGDGLDDCANMADLVGNITLDNSILAAGAENVENDGPSNPAPRTTDTPGFSNMALRELDAGVEASVSLSCNARGTIARQPVAQHNPLRGPEIELFDDPGFRIFEDDDSKPVAEPSFQIFQDGNLGANEADSNGAVGQEFAVTEQSEKPSFQIFQDVDSSANEVDTINTVGRESAGNNVPIIPPANSAGAGFAIYQDGQEENTEGDTARLSLFNELFEDLDDEDGVDRSESIIRKQPSVAHKTGIDNDSIASHQGLKDTTMQNQRNHISNDFGIVSYASTHDSDLAKARHWIKAASVIPTNARCSLHSLLTDDGNVFHLPHIPFPRDLRRKRVQERTQITIGRHSGIVRKELGRGSYGAVFLMASDVATDASTVAVKAESPTDCLPWEYELLRSLEERVRCQSLQYYPFPRAHAFMMLNDGAILSMTAGSQSGLNLVDLVNVYKVKLGEPVPELIALHFTSRLLKHVETLHGHGKILHCDMKPDNVVLVTAESPDNLCMGLKGSELMLVDFGRSLDLKKLAGEKAMNIKISGEPTQKDMRCAAIRAGKPFLFDVDTYGILCSAHVLLFGTHLEILEGRDKRWKPVKAFRRYWQKDLWSEIFDVLLNVDEVSTAAMDSQARGLRPLRESIEQYLAGQRTRLRWLMQRQENLLPESKQRLLIGKK